MKRFNFNRGAVLGQPANLWLSVWEEVFKIAPKFCGNNKRGFWGRGGHFLQRLATLSVSTPLVSALDLKVYTKDELPFLDWVPCACQQLPPRLQSRMQACGAVVWGTHYDSTHASNLGCEGNHGLACSYDVGSRKE